MLNIAMLQLTAFGFDQLANMNKGIEYCRKAKSLGADIVLFPEMWNIGYTSCEKTLASKYFNTNDPKAIDWEKNAIDLSSKYISCYKSLAKELNMAIAITYLEKWKYLPRNSVSLIDCMGKIVLTYAKVHTCDFSFEAFCTPGDEFFVCDLDTEKGKVKVGAMICFDREFPESARILMLKGAEIILVPNACELEQNRIAQLKTHAFENMLGIAVANYARPKANGHSVAFDGIAFDQGRSRNHLLIEAREEEGVFIAEFDIDKMRSYRQKESWGDAYRKPSVYTILCENEEAAVFKREDSRR